MFELSGERLPAVVGCAPPWARPRPSEAGRRGSGRRPAGCALRGAVSSRARRSAPTAPGAFLLAQRGPTRSVRPPGRPTSVAWQVAGETDYCLDGQVYTVALGRPLARQTSASTPGPTTWTGLVRPCRARWGSPRPSSPGSARRGGSPRRRGSLTGLGLETTAAHLVRALCEGIAAQVAALAGAMAGDLGRPLTALRVDGGLTRSAVLMQMQADLLQLPVEVYASPHATALGAAAVARLGLDLEDAPVGGRRIRGALRRRTSRIGADEAAERLAVPRAAAAADAADRRRAAVGELAPRDFDVVVVGRGSSGAPSLASWRCGRAVAILGAADDAGDGTSKANTAILHTRFDAVPGLLQSGLVVAAMPAARVRRGHRDPGRAGRALLVAWERGPAGGASPPWPRRLKRNGVLDALGLRRGAYTPRTAPRRWSPGRPRGAWRVGVPPPGGRRSPTRRRLSAGGEVRLETRLLAIGPAGGGRTRRPPEGQIAATYVVSAAGLRSDEVDRLFGTTGSRSFRRRGEVVVSTSSPGRWCPTSSCRCPPRAGRVCSSHRPSTATGRSADRRRPATGRATGTTEAGLEALRRQGPRIMPTLLDEEVTTTYAGCARRPSTRTTRSSCTRTRGTSASVEVRSTGLTASMAIAEHVRELNDRGRLGHRSGTRVAGRRPNMPQHRPRPSPGPAARPELVGGRPRVRPESCATASGSDSARSRDALEARAPATTEGLRRRTRAGMGRCQGFFCACCEPGAGGGRGGARGSVVTGVKRSVDVLVVGGGPAGALHRGGAGRRGCRVGGGASTGAGGRRDPPPFPPHGVRAARPTPGHDRTGVRVSSGCARRGCRRGPFAPEASVTGWAGPRPGHDQRDGPRVDHGPGRRPRDRRRERGRAARGVGGTGPVGCLHHR